MSPPEFENADFRVKVLNAPKKSSTVTLAKQTLAPKEKAKEAKFKEFWLKELCWKNRVEQLHSFEDFE